MEPEAVVPSAEDDAALDESLKKTFAFDEKPPKKGAAELKEDDLDVQVEDPDKDLPDPPPKKVDPPIDKKSEEKKPEEKKADVPPEPPIELVAPEQKKPEIEKKPYDISEEELLKLDKKKAGPVFASLKADLKAALEKANQAPTALPETEAVKQLQARLKEADDELGKVKLEKSISFQQTWDIPIGKELERAKAKLKENGIDENVALAALQQPPASRLKFIEAALKDKAPLVPIIYGIIDRIHELAVGRNTELTRWQESLAKRQKQDETGALLTTQTSRKNLLEKAIVDERASKNFMITEVPGNESWNKVVQQHVTVAQQVLDSANPEAQTRFILKGVVLDTLIPLYRAKVQEIEDLKKTIADYKAARGRLGGGAPDPVRKAGTFDIPAEATAEGAVSTMLAQSEE